MQVYAPDPLFAWVRLEDRPHLATLSQLLAAIPDRDLLDGLRAARGRGRNDYPVEHLWAVLVLTIALRHTSIESCLAELQGRGQRTDPPSGGAGQGQPPRGPHQ